MTYTLLYQGGIANVFRHCCQEPRRVMRGDYRACESFARGAEHAGARLIVQHWDGAGDALLFRQDWRDGAGDLWADRKFHAALPASDSEDEGDGFDADEQSGGDVLPI